MPEKSEAAFEVDPVTGFRVNPPATEFDKYSRPDAPEHPAVTEYLQTKEYKDAQAKFDELGEAGLSNLDPFEADVIRDRVFRGWDYDFAKTRLGELERQKKQRASDFVGPPAPRNLVDLDQEYVDLLQRQQQEVNVVNAQRASRLSELSDTEVYRQLYEKERLDGSRGTVSGREKGVLRPGSATPFYPPEKQSYEGMPKDKRPVEELPISQAIPRSLVHPRLYGESPKKDEMQQGVMEMLGQVPPGPPLLKAAQHAARGEIGATPGAEEVDWSQGGHPGDLYEGEFGVPTHGLYGESRDSGGRDHAGHDYLTPKGTPVRAPADGIISPQGIGGYITNAAGEEVMLPQGYSVRLHTDDGWMHKFFHLRDATDLQALADELNRKLNADGSLTVKKGDVVGRTGNTGKPGLGYHLHHETFKKKGEDLSASLNAQLYERRPPVEWFEYNAGTGSIGEIEKLRAVVEKLAGYKPYDEGKSSDLALKSKQWKKLFESEETK